MSEQYKLPKELKEYINDKELMDDFWSYKSNVYKSRNLFSFVVIIYIFFILLFLASVSVSSVLIYWAVNKINTSWRLWIVSIPFSIMIINFMLAPFTIGIFFYKENKECDEEQESDKKQKNDIDPFDRFSIALLSVGMISLHKPLRIILEQFKIEVAEIDKHKSFIIKGTYNENHILKLFKSLFYIAILTIVYVSLQFIIGCLCYIFVKY